MKKSIIALFALVMLSTACNKTTTAPTTQTVPTTPPTPTTPTIPTDGWTLDGTKYKQKWAFPSGAPGYLSAGDGAIGSGNSFNFFFKELPKSDGTYNVVFYAGGAQIATDEVGISAGLETAQKTYVSIGNDNVIATVTIVNGKIKVELPETKVFNTKAAGDTVILTGTLIEN